MKKSFYIAIAAAITALIWSCASTGTPSGGRTDVNPPVPLSFSPENYSTGFTAKQIVITFDERIKFKDLSKQLVVSPPIERLALDITPTAAFPSKKLVIDLSKHNLLPNTTYTINFGNAIADNNEGNELPNFKYVFSTGDTIDSLSIGGIVADAFEEKFDPKTTIMLYRADSTFNDSTIYKERPMYFTRLTDKRDSTFRIDNISPGNYHLIAMVDDNSNMLYDQAKDKIAFFPRTVEAKHDQSTGYLLRLAQGRPPYKVYQGVNQQPGLILTQITGLEKDHTVERIYPALPEGSRDYYIFSANRDSLSYWYTGEEKDSILFVVKKDGIPTDTINAKIRKPAKVDFRIGLKKQSLDLGETLVVTSNKPIGSVDMSLVQLLDIDSIPVPYSIKLDSSSMSALDIAFRIKHNSRYFLRILPGGIKSILGEDAKDTLSTAFKTKSPDDYGNLRIQPVSFSELPLIFQLLSSDGKTVRREVRLDSPGTPVFDLLPPGKYRLRVIFDTNGNGKWDTVDYMKRTQPEKVKYLKDPIEIRALWSEDITW